MLLCNDLQIFFSLTWRILFRRNKEIYWTLTILNDDVSTKLDRQLENKRPFTWETHSLVWDFNTIKKILVYLTKFSMCGPK